jgi:hypothetical protein
MDVSMINGREIRGYDTVRFPEDFSFKEKIRVEILEDHLFEWNLEVAHAREGGRTYFQTITKVVLKESKFGKDSVKVTFHHEPSEYSDGTSSPGWDATVTYKRQNAADLYEALQGALTKYATHAED